MGCLSIAQDKKKDIPGRWKSKNKGLEMGKYLSYNKTVWLEEGCYRAAGEEQAREGRSDAQGVEGIRGNGHSPKALEQ